MILQKSAIQFLTRFGLVCFWPFHFSCFNILQIKWRRFNLHQRCHAYLHKKSRRGKKGMEEISNQDLGWKELTPTNFVRFLLGRMPLLRKKGEQHKKVNNIEKTTRIWSHPPTFCYLELDPGYWQKWLLLKRQLLWTLDFLHVSIFSNFLDLHPKSISPPKTALQRSPNNFIWSQIL